MSKSLSPSIRFECEKLDKRLARAISQRYGGASMSSTMRRLIREEAQRLQIAINPQVDRQDVDGVLLTDTDEDEATNRKGADLPVEMPAQESPSGSVRYGCSDNDPW